MPSPLVFKIAQPDGTIEEVKGYCSKRKDSLAIHKLENEWFVIHKASGMNVNRLVPTDVKSYPKLMEFMDFMQANAAPEFARLDELPFNPTAGAKANAAPEMFRIREIAKTFNS